MITEIIERWKARRAQKQRETELGNIAHVASRRHHPDEEFLWSQLVLEDNEGIVVMLWYKSNTIPPRRRFWEITDSDAREMDAITATDRFKLGAYR